MKKVLILTLTIFAFASCKQDPNQTVQADDTTTTNVKTEATPDGVVYVCPMHPEVQGAKGDKCPKCEMDLVAKE